MKQFLDNLIFYTAIAHLLSLVFILFSVLIQYNAPMVRVAIRIGIITFIMLITLIVSHFLIILS